MSIPPVRENPPVLLQQIAQTSAGVAGASGRLAKIGQLAACLRQLRPQEAPVAVAFLSGELPQGTIGIGWASLRDLPPPAASATLEVLEVDSVFRRIQSTAGPGSQAVRKRELSDLF